MLGFYLRRSGRLPLCGKIPNTESFSTFHRISSLMTMVGVKREYHCQYIVHENECNEFVRLGVPFLESVGQSSSPYTDMPATRECTAAL